VNTLSHFAASRFFILVPIILTVIAIIIVILNPSLFEIKGTITLPSEITALPVQVTILHNDLASLQQKVDAISQVPADNAVA
jgi:hypothetical protein